MLDPYSSMITLVGLTLLAVLCLPFARLQKLILEFTAWGLRLTLIALLGAAAYLWFHPENLPTWVADTSNAILNACPRLKDVVPEPGTANFGACASAIVVVALLPVLAALDVSRKLAGWWLRRQCILTAAPYVVAVPPAQVPVCRVNRRAAAETLAVASARRPS